MERRTLAYLDSLPAATASLAAVKPGAVVLAHTALSYLSGHAAEPELLERLRALAGPRAFTAAAAIDAALRHLAARRIALATPYPESISAAARAFWEAAGYEVVSRRRIDTPNIYDETEATAYELARGADVASADTILISGTGLPTIGVVERLERELGKPVVTSQIATLWHALQLLGRQTPVAGYGQLLSGTTRT
jgi:maleate cis-trans isomerase